MKKYILCVAVCALASVASAALSITSLSSQTLLTFDVDYPGLFQTGKGSNVSFYKALVEPDNWELSEHNNNPRGALYSTAVVLDSAASLSIQFSVDGNNNGSTSDDIGGPGTVGSGVLPPSLTGHSSNGIRLGYDQDYFVNVFYLRIQNNTGSTITSWDLVADYFYDEIESSNGSTLQLSYAVDNGITPSAMTFIGFGALTSAAAGDSFSSLAGTIDETITVTVADGDYLVLAFSDSTSAGGSGILIDNVGITLHAPPVLPEEDTLILLGFGAFFLFFGFRKRQGMMAYFLAVFLLLGFVQTQAQLLAPNGVDVGSNFVYNVGFIDVASLTNDFTDVELANRAASVGQLVGVNPETGALVTNAVNLLPVMFRSVFSAGEVNAEDFVGSGSGLTNIPALEIVGVLPASAMPTSGVWNAEGFSILNAVLSGSVNVASNLSVGGAFSGNASGLSNVPAGGTEGSIQVNVAGVLSGNTNYYIHGQTGKLAHHSTSTNIFRAYQGGEALESELIYVVRRSGFSAEVVLRQDDVDTIRLGGEGNASISGTLEVGALTITGSGGGGTSGWYVPQSGDLSMGSFTQE